MIPFRPQTSINLESLFILHSARLFVHGGEVRAQ